MCVLGKESWTGRNQINVDNILNSLASYAIPGILCKMSDLEDKQLFQLSFNATVFLAFMAAKTRWKWDLAASQGARTGGKGKKPKYLIIYSLVNFMPVSLFWRVSTREFLTFGLAALCISGILSLYPLECSTAELVERGVSKWFPVQGCHCVCLTCIHQNWWKFHSKLLASKRCSPKIETKTVLVMCQFRSNVIFTLGFNGMNKIVRKN